MLTSAIWCHLVLSSTIDASTEIYLPIPRWLHDNRVNDGHNEGFHAHRDPGPSVLNDPKCGVRPASNRRVIDGSDAGFGTFPWQALIRIGKAKVRSEMPAPGCI